MSKKLIPGDICVADGFKNTILMIIAALDQDDDYPFWMCLANDGDIQWWYERLLTRL